MATCCDDIYDDTATAEPPRLTEFFKEQEIPFKTYYLLNNKDIFKKPVKNTGELRAQVETAFWETSTHSFKLFINSLETNAPISLTLTKELLNKKHHIAAKLPSIIRELIKNTIEIEKLEQDKQSIEKSINPTKEVEVTKREMVDIQEPNCFSTW